MRFLGRVGFVTGAAGGVGRGLAAALLDEGAEVVLVDRDPDRLAELVQALGRPDKVLAAAVDITDPEAITAVVAAGTERFGRLDILINNAGTSVHSPFLDVSQETLRQELDVHVSAPFFLIQQVVPRMRAQGYGRIVNVSSVAALMGPIDLSPYAAAKAGLLGITRAAALEFAQDGITVNAVALGPIATDLLRRTWPAEQLAARADHLPMRRLGEVADAVHAITFFCAEDTGFITGTVLPVDGGSVAAGAYMVEQYRRWHAGEGEGG